jgi:hypothetical protein
MVGSSLVNRGLLGAGLVDSSGHGRDLIDRGVLGAGLVDRGWFGTVMDRGSLGSDLGIGVLGTGLAGKEWLSLSWNSLACYQPLVYFAWCQTWFCPACCQT